MTQTLLKKASPHVPTKGKLDYKNFLSTFYTNVPKDDFEMMAPENIAFTASNHLELSHKRKFGDEPQISVITPTKSKQGWDANHTVIDIVNDDMAFLVDSVVAEIIRHKLQITVFIHPILHVIRDKNGKIKDIQASPKEGKTQGQSHIHIELSRAISKDQAAALKDDLLNVLKDTKYANRDWQDMRQKLKDAQEILGSAPKKYAKETIHEYQEFLEYLHDNNFTLLGYREYNLKKTGKQITSKVVKGSSLGLLSDDITPVYINEARKSLTEAQQELRIK